MGLGFDPLELPADRFFNWMWSVVMRGRNETERARLSGELHMPLPGQNLTPDDVQVGPWSDAEMASSFRALQAETGGIAR